MVNQGDQPDATTRIAERRCIRHGPLRGMHYCPECASSGHPWTDFVADMANVLFAAESALSHAQERWQPIETAPKDGRDVLACWADCPGWNARALRYDATDAAWKNEDDHSYREPTHWKPLPSPPEVTR